MSASAILKLQNAGFTVEQVTALAELIDTQAATKADVENARHHLDARITDLDHRLDQKIDAVEHRLEMRITKIEADVTVLKWMMGFILAFQVAIFAKLVLKF